MGVELSIIHVKVLDEAPYALKRKLNCTGNEELNFPFVFVGICREKMVCAG